MANAHDYKNDTTTPQQAQKAINTTVVLSTAVINGKKHLVYISIVILHTVTVILGS